MKRNNIFITCSKRHEAAPTMNDLPFNMNGHWWAVGRQNVPTIPNICPFNYYFCPLSNRNATHIVEFDKLYLH